MFPIQTTNPERQVRSEDSPEGALMMTSGGYLAIRAGIISAQLVGDDSPRPFFDLETHGHWTILSSENHELELPEESFTVTSRPDSTEDLAGVDTNGQSVVCSKLF